MRIKHYKPGDIENNVWSGDIVSKCEFIMYLPFGIMVFREISPSPCLRAVYYAIDHGEVFLNGWDAYQTLSQLKCGVVKKLLE